MDVVLKIEFVQLRHRHMVAKLKVDCWYGTVIAVYFVRKWNPGKKRNKLYCRKYRHSAWLVLKKKPVVVHTSAIFSSCIMNYSCRSYANASLANRIDGPALASTLTGGSVVPPVTIIRCQFG